MIILILINGIRGVLKGFIVVKNGVYKLFQMLSWKAIYQDTVPSYNKGNTKVQNIGGRGGGLAGVKGKKGRRKGRK